MPAFPSTRQHFLSLGRPRNSDYKAFSLNIELSVKVGPKVIAARCSMEQCRLGIKQLNVRAVEQPVDQLVFFPDRSRRRREPRLSGHPDATSLERATCPGFLERFLDAH